MSGIGDYHLARDHVVAPLHRHLGAPTGKGTAEDIEAGTEVTDPTRGKDAHLFRRGKAPHRWTRHVMGGERCHDAALSNSRRAWFPVIINLLIDRYVTSVGQIVVTNHRALNLSVVLDSPVAPWRLWHASSVSAAPGYSLPARHALRPFSPSRGCPFRRFFTCHGELHCSLHFSCRRSH